MSDFEARHSRDQAGRFAAHHGADQPGELTDGESAPGTDVAVNAAQPARGTRTFTDGEGHSYELREDRIVRDGTHTAVLVSGGFGAGFSSWNDSSPFEPAIVAAVLAGRNDLITAGALREHLGINAHDSVTEDGAQGLYVEWVPAGTRFKVQEYDGSEYLVTENDLDRTA